MSTLTPTYSWKKSPKEPWPPLVRVKWRDAVAWSSWTSLEDAIKVQPDEVETVGRLLAWDETAIHLASTVSESSQDGHFEITNGFSIPNVWASSVVYLETVDAEG